MRLDQRGRGWIGQRGEGEKLESGRVDFDKDDEKIASKRTRSREEFLLLPS